MAVYDKIGEKYIKNVSLKRTLMYDPAFVSVLGNIEGKSVMDVACGEGYYTRLMKNLGAVELVGIDISSKMIDLAKSNPENEGIHFYIGDAINLVKIGEFYIVTGTLLLHYSKTKDELFKMCTNLYNNLKEGGKFVALNNNPRSPLQPWAKYGILVETVKDTSLREGDEIKIIFLKDGQEDVSFVNYYWSEQTYREALSQAGFRDIKFYDAKISKEHLTKEEREFWKEYIEQPGLMVIECFK